MASNTLSLGSTGALPGAPSLDMGAVPPRPPALAPLPGGGLDAPPAPPPAGLGLQPQPPAPVASAGDSAAAAAPSTGGGVGGWESLGEVSCSPANESDEAGATAVTHSGLVSSAGCTVCTAAVPAGTTAAWDVLPTMCRLDVAECLVGFMRVPPDASGAAAYWGSDGIPASASAVPRHSSVLACWSDQTKVYARGTWLDQVGGMAWWMRSRLSLKIDRTKDPSTASLKFSTDGGPSNPAEECEVPVPCGPEPVHFFVYLYREQESDDEDGDVSEMKPTVTIIPKGPLPTP